MPPRTRPSKSAPPVRLPGKGDQIMTAERTIADANRPAALVGDREIAATRIFDAPRELVFWMWADPNHIGQWWGPKGFTTTTFSMDFKPGGVWRYVMTGPDGRDYQNRITFSEIVENERIVFKHGGGDETEPVSHETFVTFSDHGAG